MISNRSIPDCVVIPILGYRDVAEAAAWLCAAFGFEERLRIHGHRVQLTFGAGGAVIAVERTGEEGDRPRAALSVLVRVDDVDGHCARAKAAGATILCSPQNQPYGERQYRVEDIGGHIWTFSQSIADVDPASWGGVSGAVSRVQ